MEEQIYKLLISKAISEREEGLTTLKLLCECPAGIGDHSTSDFYSNANEALTKLVDAEDKIAILEKYKEILFTKKR